ncbi:hypothetical protein K7I13_13280 [Brucepastera parasyntrophica]|uniref:hypothetical protein n=1 Tax=Brucepastera parasyntrophica TaxID=2880008 RepID=UPI00210A92CC|nr:hypothetical protein [Brucepastera parasyntrophica]ULQ59436.1 hypothetical protein K7I13_13280 [Brucepastera parasyntrophica]
MKPVRFLSGSPEKRETLTGMIEGIGSSGELLFRPETDSGSVLRLFSGEICYD